MYFLTQPGVGPGKFRKLWSSNSIDEHESVRKVFISFYSDEIKSETSKVIEECEKLRISIFSVFDEEYPTCLKTIADFPPVIFAKGNTKDLNSECYAVVGTRQASDYGRKIAYNISSKLCKINKTVVSGLALGIDTEAHKGALSVKGKTIAILAHGLDMVAPSSNKKLAEEILDTDGTLISEHPPGTPARPPEFARRNRIQSGMSRGSIVVESGVPGGAMIQAEFTFKQKRKLFAILPDETYPPSQLMNCEGANHMIKNFKAVGVKRWEELLNHLSPENTIQ